MARYIDADELEKELKWEVMFDYDADYQYVTKYDIDNTPTADVAVVKHGRWIEKQLPMPLSDGSMECVECSVCHTHWDGETNYCPNCGAKMDEVDE